MLAVEELSAAVGLKRACQDLSIPRSRLYRRRRRRFAPVPVAVKTLLMMTGKDRSLFVVPQPNEPKCEPQTARAAESGVHVGGEAGNVHVLPAGRHSSPQEFAS